MIYCIFLCSARIISPSLFIGHSSQFSKDGLCTEAALYISTKYTCRSMCKSAAIFTRVPFKWLNVFLYLIECIAKCQDVWQMTRTGTWQINIKKGCCIAQIWNQSYVNCWLPQFDDFQILPISSIHYFFISTYLTCLSDTSRLISFNRL